MSSTLLTLRSPSFPVMSQSHLNHAYDTNQKKNMNIPESKQLNLNHSNHTSLPSQQTSNNTNNNDHNNNSNDHNNTNDNHGGTNHASSSYSTPYHQPHATDKIQLKSTNRSTHHQVSADNWRIRYYMNLNLVKQPQHISLQYRSSSLPTHELQQHVNSNTPPSKLPSQHDNYNKNNNDYLSFDQYDNKTRKSIEKKHDDNNDNDDNNESDEDPLGMGKVHNLDSTKSMDFVKPKRKKSSSKHKNKLIHIVSKTKSQNNTPPRPIASMLKKHHKKSRLSRIRSRSDGMLSFQANKKSSSSTSSSGNNNNKNSSSTSSPAASSSDSIIDDDDNDSVSTTDSVNNHHLNSIHNLTPPRTSKISKINTQITNSRANKHSHPRPSPNSSLVYQSSRTPPANNYNGTNYMAANNNRNYSNNTKTHSRRHHNNVQQRKIWSEPVGYPPKSASIAIHRSRPMSINKKKVKSRFDVDFKPSRDNSYQPSSDPLFTNLTNPDSLLDDEANFDME